jgi:tRNA G46 methylase TrmB
MSLSSLLETNELCVSKNILGTDTDYRHSCIRVYDHIFSSFSPKSILEIGVAHGALLCLWKLYFPNSKVMGIDNSKKSLHNLARQQVERNLIEIKIRDAYRLKTGAKFDLIIDDGPHTLKSQV